MHYTAHIPQNNSADWRSIWRMALRALRRDGQSGELHVLVVALLIAVASVASVGFFTDRIEQAMERKASELLGADWVITATHPLPAHLAEEAQRRGLQTAQTLRFRSVVLAGDTTQLAEVKAVSVGYPLRGTLQISSAPFAPTHTAPAIPQSGEVWLDERLLQTLGLSVGEQLQLGATTFRIAQVLVDEPDRAGELFSIAPRLLMNIADLAATQLVQPGSRIEYRLLLAGEAAPLSAFKAWAEALLSGGEKGQGVREARAELRSALERAERFLHLAAVVSVILAGVGVAIAARRFAMRHWDSVTIMRCLGATEALIFRMFLLELLVLGLLAGIGGLLLGYVAQFGLSEVLGQLVSTSSLPAPSWYPVFPALASGLITLLGFGLPPLLRLREVPPLRVLRRDLGPVQPRWLALYAPAVATSVILLAWQAGEWRLALAVAGGVIATMLVLSVAAWLLVKALNVLRGQVGIAWHFGLANIARRGAGSVVQVVALGVGLMALLLLGVVRTDLLHGWRASLPADAPNHFLINIANTDVAGLSAFLRHQNLHDVTLLPMVRGRWVTHNQRPVVSEAYTNPRAQRLAAREFNLSWAEHLQDDNRIVAGHWWNPTQHGQGLASVEVELAETLGIALGDTLHFQVADQVVAVQVTSLRRVQWDSFRANFFVLLPPGVLDNYPNTWITSFYLPAERKPILAELVRQYPSVTILDVDALMTKVREIVERVISAVEYVFLFTLAAGLAVLYAAIQATQDQRSFESALLRTLGAPRQVVRRSLLAEFATLGLLAGVLAAAAATIISQVLAHYVFDFSYAWNPWLWLLGGLIGAGGVGIAGLLGARSALNQAPWQALREGALGNQ